MVLHLPVISAYAQDPLLKHFSLEQGLPSNTLYRIIQDKRGFIWFGSNVGATRFDGKTFENFSISDGLSDNDILAIREDSKGRIWFLGFNGTVSYWFNDIIYNETNDSMLRHLHSEASFVDMFEDNEHQIWFLSQKETFILKNNHVSRLYYTLPLARLITNGKKGQLILSYNPSQLCRIASNKISILPFTYPYSVEGSYYRLTNGDLMYSSSFGIVKMHDGEQKLILNLPISFKNERHYDMELTKKNKLWLSTSLGLFCYDALNLKKQPTQWLKNKLSCDLLEDKEGNLWITTLDDGLYMLPTWTSSVKTLTTENGLSQNQCYSINKLSNGDLIVGLKYALNCIKENTLIDKINLPNSSKDFKVTQIIQVKDNLMIATESRLLKYNLTTHQFKNTQTQLSSLIQTKNLSAIKDISKYNDKIYIACNYSLFSYNQNPSSPLNNSGETQAKLILKTNARIFSVFKGYGDDLWFGSKRGLMSIKGKRISYYSNIHPILSKRINDIAQTADSTLVLATHGYGLVFLKNKTITHSLTINNGLSNDICRKIVVKNNHIYVSTPSGISDITYINGKIEGIINLNTNNFLTSNDINDMYVSDSSIVVASSKGITMVNLAAIGQLNYSIPYLNFTKFTCNGKRVNMNDKLSFTYLENNIRIGFTGICFHSPEGVNYRYRIVHSLNWENTQSRFVDFSFLPPGEYQFELQSRINLGRWSAAKIILFTINPPFWETWWFRFIVGILLVFTVYLFILFRIKRFRKIQEEKNKIEKQITNLEQQALQGMMNPHFIFNVMNSIQHFINANDNQSANQYLADFAKLIRMNLTISYKKFITLEEELEYLNLYLSFEKLRFGNNLQYEILVDESIDESETYVAVMMIQPFLENAIWHGIVDMKSGGLVELKINKQTSTSLHIMVIDNGIGIPDAYIGKINPISSNKSLGMNITIQRLQLLCKVSDVPFSLTFSHVNPNSKYKGTMLEMSLPASI